MEKVKLGTTALQVAPINLGGNVFGWTLNEKESFEILDGFVDANFNFIDTADTYSYWVPGNTGGESETIIGNWLKQRGNRQDIVLATKVGYENNDRPADISKKNIIDSVEKSLARLQTDYIDLYYTHIDDGKTPVDETMEAHAQLVKEGKVRHIGASNLSVKNLISSMEYAHIQGIPAYEVYQIHYNLVERAEFEDTYSPITSKYNLSVLPYYSLASGFLTGKYRSAADLGKSPRGGGANQYLNEKGLGILAALDQVSEKHGAQPAAIALAWLLKQPAVVAPVVSATSKQQLAILTQAPNIILDSDDLNTLNKASI